MINDIFPVIDDDMYDEDDFFDENIYDPYDNIDDYNDEDYLEDVALSQQAGCLPVFLMVTGAALVLMIILSKIGISIPGNIDTTIQTAGSSGQGGGKIAALFTPEVQYWSASITRWSEQTGIDANIIATVMQIESCGDPFAKSSAGAMGLFQVMPYHFEGSEDPYKPATNALRGLNYLQRALAARDGVVRLGLAGYNGGITGAKRPESQWANETQRYVYWGSGIYEDAIKGKSSSERLEEWLNRGGASLCKQASLRLGIER